MNIEWIHLHNLLSKANERAVESRKIYQKLDEALRRELGRVIERGPLQGERPADDELDQYEEVRIPEMDDTELANATPMHPSLGVMAGVPACAANQRTNGRCLRISGPTCMICARREPHLRNNSKPGPVWL